jgi:hypothetical protein
MRAMVRTAPHKERDATRNGIMVSRIGSGIWETMMKNARKKTGEVHTRKIPALFTMPAPEKGIGSII